MDTNRLLVWFTVLGAVANVMALVIVRGKPTVAQMSPYFIVYAVLGLALVWVPEVAGLAGFVAFAVCVLIPGLWTQLVVGLLVRQRYRLASVLAPWLRATIRGLENGNAPLTEQQRARMWELQTTLALQRGTRQGPAPATAVLVFANLVAYGVEVPGGAEDERNLLRLGGLEVPVTAWAIDWWRFLTACFLHFGVLHITMNMLALLLFGRWVERRLGSWRFVLIYLASGIAGMALYAGIGELLQWDPKRVVVGASGCVMALVGTRLGMSFKEWRRSHSLMSRRDLAIIGIVVGTQMIFDVMVPEVAMTVHSTGLVLGALFGLLFAPGHDVGSPSR